VASVFNVLGEAVLLVPAALMIFFVLFIRGYFGLARAWLIANVTTIMLIALAKLAIFRCGAGLGFGVVSPSGHVSLATTFYPCVALLLSRTCSRNGRTLAFVAALVLVSLIGASRVAVGDHVKAEVIVGFAIGLAGVMAYAVFASYATTEAIRIGAGRHVVATVVSIAAAAVGVDTLLQHWTPEPTLQALSTRLGSLGGECNPTPTFAPESKLLGL